MKFLKTLKNKHVKIFDNANNGDKETIVNLKIYLKIILIKMKNIIEHTLVEYYSIKNDQKYYEHFEKP